MWPNVLTSTYQKCVILILCLSITQMIVKKKKKIMHMFTAYCALCHHTTGRFMHCVNATVLLWCAPTLSVLSALNDTLEYLE